MDIKKNILEKYLQNCDHVHLNEILQNADLSFCIDLLSVDKNMKLLTKKADFYFLKEVFNHLSNLKESSFLSFLSVSNECFKQIIHTSVNKEALSLQQKNDRLRTFIEKTVDLSIQQHKKHTIKDIEILLDLGSKYHISSEKIVNWLGKVTHFSQNPNILDYNHKLSLLQKSDLRERYVSLLINISDNTNILNKTYQLYEPYIYNIYAKYKMEGNIWSCLLPKRGYYGAYLPYIDENKLNWLEEKKIGYRNNPVFFELYSLSNMFQYKDSKLNEKINNEYYREGIYSSLLQYRTEFLPEVDKFLNQAGIEATDTHSITHLQYRKEFREWLKESPLRVVLNLYFSNPSFLQFCEKLDFKNTMDIHLPTKEVKKTTNKI